MDPASTTNPLHGATDPYQPSATPTLTTSTSSDWLASKITSVDLTTTAAAPQAYALAAHEEGHGKDGVEGHGALVAGGGGGGHGGGGGGDDGDDEGDGHDDGHGHSTKIAPTRVPDWLGDIIEKVFKIRKRKTTVEMECFCGVVQFISCLYVLPVVPFQMKRVGYDETASIVATTVTCAIGSIASSFLTDMPLIIAPPTSVSIFLAVSMQQANFDKDMGCASVILSGAGLVVIGALPPVARFISKLIPDCIQAATSIGIGLITALAGCTEINLVVKGKYTILDMGEITSEVIIAIAALILVTAALHFHVKGAFCIGLFFGTFVWWVVSGEWPEGILALPEAEKTVGSHDTQIVLLVFNLLFLYFLTLNGLARSLSDLAGLTKKSGAIPRGNFLLIVCGLTTILSGFFTGPPILISPESAAGIKAGAKTGLSTLVCGILFGVATFFYPVFAAVPAAGTAPLLIMVGVVLFANTKRVDWSDYRKAVPAYTVLFFIPFTYSILRGVAFGYILYILIAMYTGDLFLDARALWDSYTVRKKVEKKVEVLHDEEELPGRLERSKSGLAAMVDSVITTFGDMEVNDITFDHA